MFLIKRATTSAVISPFCSAASSANARIILALLWSGKHYSRLSRITKRTKRLSTVVLPRIRERWAPLFKWHDYLSRALFAALLLSLHFALSRYSVIVFLFLPCSHCVAVPPPSTAALTRVAFCKVHERGRRLAWRGCGSLKTDPLKFFRRFSWSPMLLRLHRDPGFVFTCMHVRIAGVLLLSPWLFYLSM